MIKKTISILIIISIFRMDLAFASDANNKNMFPDKEARILLSVDLITEATQNESIREQASSDGVDTGKESAENATGGSSPSDLQDSTRFASFVDDSINREVLETTVRHSIEPRISKIENMIRATGKDSKPIVDKKEDKNRQAERERLEVEIKDVKEVEKEAKKGYVNEPLVIDEGDDVYKKIVEDPAAKAYKPSKDISKRVEESFRNAISRKEKEVQKEVSSSPWDPRVHWNSKINHTRDALKEGRPLTPEQEALHLNIANYLKSGIEQIKDAFSKDTNPLVLLIGVTGSGKTTLARWLTNEPLTARIDPFNANTYILDTVQEKLDHEVDHTAIGHGTKSKTTRPTLWNISNSRWAFADCPGFNDTGGITQDIINALYLYELFRNREAIKLLIVEPISAFGVGRGQHFVEILKKLKAQLEKVQYDHISLVVTQHTEGHDKSLKNLRSFMQSLSKEQEDPEVKSLLLAFSNEKNNNIAIFSHPKTEGLFENDREKNILHQMIIEMKPLKLDFKKDVKISLDSDAVLLLKEIKEKLSLDLKNILTKNVVTVIERYYQGKIEANIREINSMLLEAMTVYTPVTFIMGHKNKLERTYYEEVKEIARQNPKIRKNQGALNGCLVGGAVITEVLLATLGPATFGITFLIAAAIGGITYFIKKEFWKAEVLSCIIEKRGKELREEFGSLAKQVRSIKFNVHNGCLLDEEGTIRHCSDENGIVDDIRLKLSEIKALFQALEAVYYILGVHSTCFSQEVWHPTFSELEKNLRELSHQSGEKFYKNEISKLMTAVCSTRKSLDLDMNRKEESSDRIGLSISGGGIRGILPAMHLDEIENLSGQRVMDLFDVIGGAAGGGIAGLGLVVPDQSGVVHKAQEFVNLYRTQGRELFSTPESLKAILNEKFQDVTLGKALKAIVVPDKAKSSEGIIFTNDDKAYVRDVAFAAFGDVNYSPENNRESTGKAPLNFSSVDISYNNPSLCVYLQMRKLYPNDQYYIISLGMGSFKETLIEAGNSAERFMNAAEKEIIKLMSLMSNKPKYIPINPDLEKLNALDDVSEENIDFLAQQAESMLLEIEEITRFLLINFDAKKDNKPHLDENAVTLHESRKSKEGTITTGSTSPLGRFRGSFNGINTMFKEDAAKADGNCGYYVLGVSREEAETILLKSSNLTNVRELVYPEVKAAFTGGDFHIQSIIGSGEVDDEVFRQEAIYRKFISHSLQRGSWLTVMPQCEAQKDITGILDAIAFLKGKKVYVWQKLSKHSNEIKVIHESPNEGDAIHMFHTDRGTHFNMLSIESEESFIPVSADKKVTAPLSSDLALVSIPDPVVVAALASESSPSAVSMLEIDQSRSIYPILPVGEHLITKDGVALSEENRTVTGMRMGNI